MIESVFISVNDKGVSATGGLPFIEHRTVVDQFVVDELVPFTDAVVFRECPAGTLRIAELANIEVHMIICTRSIGRIIHLIDLSAIAHQFGNGILLSGGS